MAAPEMLSFHSRNFTLLQTTDLFSQLLVCKGAIIIQFNRDPLGEQEKEILLFFFGRDHSWLRSERMEKTDNLIKSRQPNER